MVPLGMGLKTIPPLVFWATRNCQILFNMVFFSQARKFGYFIDLNAEEAKEINRIPFYPENQIGVVGGVIFPLESF